MKIYAVFSAIVVALLIWALNLRADLAEFKEQNAFIINANKELNATLSKVIERNALEKKVLAEKFEATLEIERKKQKALNYVKNSTERNVTQLFNDSLLLLQ